MAAFSKRKSKHLKAQLANSFKEAEIRFEASPFPNTPLTDLTYFPESNEHVENIKLIQRSNLPKLSVSVKVDLEKSLGLNVDELLSLAQETSFHELLTENQRLLVALENYQDLRFEKNSKVGLGESNLGKDNFRVHRSFPRNP